MIEIHRIPPENKEEFIELVEEAVKLFKNKKIAAMPSDTIYGVFGIFQNSVIERLHKIKKREKEKPFLVLLGSKTPIESLIDKDSLGLVQEAYLKNLWPGRNTLLFNKNKNLDYPPGEKIAIRVPSKSDNEFLFEVLERLNEPLLAPSLNFHGEDPVENKDEIVEKFGSLIDAVFYDSSFKPREPSAIIDLTVSPFQKIR